MYLKISNDKDSQNINQSLYLQYSKVKILFVERQDLGITKTNMVLNCSLSLNHSWKQSMEIHLNKNPIFRKFLFKNSTNNVKFYFHKIKFLIQYNLKLQRNRFQHFFQKKLQNCHIIFFFQKKSILNYFQECSFFSLFEQFNKIEIQHSLLNLNSQKFEKKTFWFNFLKSQNLLNDLSCNHFKMFFQSFCAKDYFQTNWKNNSRFFQNLGKQFENFNDLKKYKLKKNQNQINAFVLKSSVSYCLFEFVLRSFKTRNYSKLPTLKNFFYENYNLKSQLRKKYLVRILILCSLELLRSTKVLKKNKNSILSSLFNFQKNSFLKINSKNYLLKQFFNQIFSLYSETLLNLSFSKLNIHSFLSEFINPSFKLFSNQPINAIENYIKKLEVNFYSIKKVQYKLLKINLLQQFQWGFISSSNFNSLSSMNLNFFKKYSFFSLKLNFFKIFLKKKINHNNFFLKQTEQIKNLEDTQHLKTQNYLFSIFQKAEIISLKKSDSFNRFVSFSLKFQILKNSLLILYNYKHYFFFFINSKIKNRFYPYLNDKSQKKNQLLSGLVLKHFYKSKQKTNILDNAYNRFFTVEKDTILIVQMPFLMFNLNQNLINKLSDLVKTLQSCFYFNFFNIQLRKNSEIINFSKTKSLELFSPALNLKFKNFFIKYKFYKLKKQNFFYKISLKTIIKNPQKEITTSNFKLSESTIRNYLQILKKLVKMHSSETQALLIRKLNTKIYSFCYYWSLTKKLNYLTYLDQELFLILWRWAYRRHNNKSKNWIKLKYFYKVGFRNWIFANKIKPSEKFEESSEKTLIFFIYLPFHTQISQNLKKFKTLQLNKLELLK